MNALEEKMKQADDQLIHHMYVTEAGRILVRYAFEQENDPLALALFEQLLTHNASSATSVEFFGYQEKITTPPFVSVSEFAALVHHWRKNPHHPEYWLDWVSIEKNLFPPYPFVIPTTFSDHPHYVAEMCCDWYAVATMKGMSLAEYWENEAPKRWVFHDETRELIDEYIQVLVKGLSVQ